MPRTYEDRVLPISYWNAMVVQMAESLRQVAASELATEDFPCGTLADAEAFMTSVSEDIYHRMFGTIPSNPLASTNNAEFARRALLCANNPTLLKLGRGDVNMALLMILHFLGLFHRTRELTSSERKIASAVAEFFAVCHTRRAFGMT